MSQGNSKSAPWHPMFVKLHKSLPQTTKRSFVLYRQQKLIYMLVNVESGKAIILRVSPIHLVGIAIQKLAVGRYEGNYVMALINILSKSFALLDQWFNIWWHHYVVYLLKWRYVCVHCIRSWQNDFLWDDMCNTVLLNAPALNNSQKLFSFMYLYIC